MNFVKRHNKALLNSSICAVALILAFNNCTGMSQGQFQTNNSSFGVTPAPTPVATPPPIQGNNLIINGDFENGLTGWSTGTGIITSDAHSGVGAANLGPSGGGLSQKVSVTAGKIYRATAFGKRSLNSGGAQFYYGYRLPDGTDKSAGVGFYSSDYHRMTFDIAIPVGVTQIGIYVYKAADGFVYIDDVSVVEVTPLADPPRLVAEGDSITVGGYANFYANGTHDLFFYRSAVGGSGMSGAFSRLPTVLSKNPDLVTIFMGANDFGGIPSVYRDKLFDYCAQVRAANAKCAVATVLPQDSSNPNRNIGRAELNQYLREAVGKQIDGVIDFDQDQELASDSAGLDKNFYPDGVHPSALGHERMFLIYKPVVDRLLGKSP